MEIKTLTVEAIQISGLQGLDPIQVYWEDFEPGKGKVTITCYGEAWTGYWSAMGNRTIKQFFREVDDDYIANRITGSQFQKHNSGHTIYLKRIVRAVREYLKAEKIAEVMS